MKSRIEDRTSKAGPIENETGQTLTSVFRVSFLPLT